MEFTQEHLKEINSLCIHPDQLQGNADGSSVSRRSGRVRKKSSKLLDFQSPDEVDKKSLKRATKPARIGGGQRGRPPNSKRLRMLEDFNESAGDDDEDDTDGDEPFDLGDANVGDVFAPGDSDDELDELVADIVEGVEAESMEHTNIHGDSKVRQSLYMTEKANKRKMLKDGKVVTGKMERKDKGKTRYTAYSMWAREFRKTTKFSKNQDLDFSNAARRLGELWANVSNKEKSAWRRKAKIQATKAKAREKAANVLTASSNAASFYNRATTSRTRKLAAGRQETPPPLVQMGVNNNTRGGSGTSTKRKRNNSHNVVTSNNHAHVDGGSYYNQTSIVNHASYSSSTHKKTGLPNTEPIDAAAYLKLLGESLTIIGERLKEHEGQIAVSGSLSVLLDSLLCSLGPLLCLTKHIPGFEKKPQLGENLSATLDNIAYVMPGL